jgi:hypothetical protein
MTEDGHGPSDEGKQTEPDDNPLADGATLPVFALGDEIVRGLVVELDGDRYDIGNIPSWLWANIEMSLDHDDGEMNAAVADLLQEQFE